MGINIDDVKVRLKELTRKGHLLYFSLLYEDLNDAERKHLAKMFESQGFDVNEAIEFNTNYEVWYSEALTSIKLLLPDRLNDFIQLYKNDKRKGIDPSTYTISDAILGITGSRGDALIFKRSTALPKMQQQVSILESAAKTIESVMYSMQFSLRADLFDSELDAANELLKAGFFRATGAMSGVVLEKHLAQVCIQHGIAIKKKSPTINEFNEELKNANVIDLPTWRNIQLLGDLRNLCCHDKSVEPTKEQANDLLTGVSKIIKKVY